MRQSLTPLGSGCLEMNTFLCISERSKIFLASELSFYSDGTVSADLHDHYRLLKSGVSVGSDLLGVIPPAGLSAERLAYLEHEVAPLMPLEYRESIYMP